VAFVATGSKYRQHIALEERRCRDLFGCPELTDEQQPSDHDNTRNARQHGHVVNQYITF
jgi:hypothetical protein